MGMSDQAGNELDEFMTDTLRNNLLGLPMDLAAINIARGRSEGVPSLNNFRRAISTRTNDAALAPYTSWVDFGENLKHPESLINFVAAYGKHPTILAATTVAAKRAAARAIVDPAIGDVAPADAAGFMNAGWQLDRHEHRAGRRRPVGRRPGRGRPTCSAACSAARSTTSSRTS